jgi:hypothetical protein
MKVIKLVFSATPDGIIQIIVFSDEPESFVSVVGDHAGVIGA